MNNLHAKKALLTDGWHDNVRITLDQGLVAQVAPGSAFQLGDEQVEVLVPGMPNLHSHAFQRAMAGLAERRGPTSDNFWSWRNEMYRFALSMTPSHVEAVASLLYVEMLEAGFTRVGEFHYLHHDFDGRLYANIAEMAERIAAASEQAGIGLTLLPVFYAHSGFGGLPPVDGQRRFITDIDAFARLMEGCRAVLKNLSGAQLGIAPHSLRAVTPVELEQLVSLNNAGPIHIHVAEQVKEVEDCVAWSGARPVEWLLANAPVDERWCLIHATHMTETETQAMARSGAVAGLCPLTESNLGDGIFPAVQFLQDGGRFGVGSDSNVQISVAAELRQLEYSQRLGNRGRNIVALPGASTGRSLFEGTLTGGHAALGVSGGISVGNAADLVSLDSKAAPYLQDDQMLDGWIFSESLVVDDVWVAGRKRVQGGRHLDRDTVQKRFLAAMNELTNG